RAISGNTPPGSCALLDKTAPAALGDQARPICDRAGNLVKECGTMSETRPTKGGRTGELSVAVELGDAGDERPQRRVYAFSSRGRPLGAAAPDVQGVATMRVRASQEAEELRVLVGP